MNRMTSKYLYSKQCCFRNNKETVIKLIKDNLERKIDAGKFIKQE